MNGLAALRGTPDDYNRWERELGCDGWGWNEMLQAFVALEHDADYDDDSLHGRGGPLPLARLPATDQSPFDHAVCAALDRRGYPTVDDYHQPGATGISRWAFTLRAGRRVSTNDAYLERARDRANLQIRGDTLVDRVFLEGTRAVGVRIADGEEITANRVIVAAGAIHSPAILQRSNIGLDDGRAVGANLKDHTTAWLSLALHPAGRKRTNDGPVIHSVLRYSSSLAEAGPNDMQLLWFNSAGPDDDGLASARLGSAVMRVYSHGTVKIRSLDPYDDPVVEFNLLSDDRDVTRLCDGIRQLIDVVHDTDVARLVETATAGTLPLERLASEQDIIDWLQTVATDYVHSVGTCRMGAVSDPAAVVDPQCRVIGYDQLYVCDASVVPDIPRANTHLTVVAIAERLAKLLPQGPTPATA